MKNIKRRTAALLLTAVLAICLFPAYAFADGEGSGDVWWKYDSSRKTLYISDEENKGSGYAVFTEEEQRTVAPGQSINYGFVCTCEDAVKVVIQGSPAPAETKFWFHRMNDLETIENLRNLDTSKVTDMSWMFGLNYSLESLDLSNFDTANVTDMSRMFYECSSLTELDLSSFNTEKVTNMYAMFNTCHSLESVNISGFSTALVTNMSNMFYQCESLESVDISSFDISNVTTMTYMFADCGSLETIYSLPETDWTESPANMDNMFNGCDVLTGGQGTAYSASHLYKKYVRTDRAGLGKPGYFTSKTPDPVKYLVFFNMNGHGTQVEEQEVLSGGKALEPSPKPSAKGWIFGGWYLNAECRGEPFDFDTPIDELTELFALWTADPSYAEYEVSFNMNGHGEQVAAQTVERGEKAEEPSPAPSETGWNFGGWYLNAECTGEPFDFDTPIEDDTELFAKWTEKSVEPPDTDDDTSPDTGDSTGAGLYALALSLILFLVFALNIYGGKKRI